MRPPSPVLQVEGVSKWFWTPRAPNGAVADPRREPASRRRDRFYALRNVSFALAAGEAVGLVGPNGSGKSTLLKILAGVMTPDAGRSDLRGRVGALLELGAGFHPDLTGIENVYLNGALLGLDRRTIDRLVPDIIAFAELERFMDMPVRHYSSGMAARLGFAVATRLLPDVILIDETFAVGDAAFQARALAHIARMKAEGRTLLLVSHNLDILLQLCDRALWLDRGRLVCDGPAREVLADYRRTAPDALDVSDRTGGQLGVHAAFETTAPQHEALVRIASAMLNVEGEPDPRYAPPVAPPPAGTVAIRMGQTLRVALELVHPGPRPERVRLESAWVRDDERILAQSRAAVELEPHGDATCCALRFERWALTEGLWRLVLAISPERPPDGAPWRHYHRRLVDPPVAVTTPNPIELRVVMPIDCRWTIDPT